jgi:hypothetical protein
MRKYVLKSVALALLLAVVGAEVFAQAGSQSSPAGGVRKVGSIVKVSGTDLSLATDQGSKVEVKVQPGARLIRTAPGAKDLKGATAIQITDLQVGDRVLVLGAVEGDGVTLDARSVVVMKLQDITKVKQQELQDWRRGVGGLVKQVDLQAGSITLSVGGQTVVVSTTPQTTYKRYAPDSMKWEDATDAKLSDIHPGDQLHAKGNKNEDGTKLTAEEIVAGSFRNIAGLVTVIDAAQGTLTVQDLATKKPVTVKVTEDSQMKNLPAQLAQGIGMRLKLMKAGGAPPAAASGQGAHAPGDLNQMLARLPAATLGDLTKGEAVMIVSTEGSATRPPMAVTLLGGVEPILTAAPEQSAQSFLTPWSLASAPAGEEQ